MEASKSLTIARDHAEEVLEQDIETGTETDVLKALELIDQAVTLINSNT